MKQILKSCCYWDPSRTKGLVIITDTSRVNGEKPLNVVIVSLYEPVVIISHTDLIAKVDGSLAGLLYRIMFKRLGHSVHLLEQATSSNRADQAAGIGLGPRGLGFLKMHDRCKEPYAFICPGF